MLGEDLQDVAVRLYNGVTIFDNCEFTNITVDYTDYSFGDGSGGAVRADGTSRTLHFNQSKLTNITVKRTNFGYIHGAVLSLDGEEPDVKLVNTIIADNSLSYEGPPDDGWPPSGGVIKWGGSGGHLQLINSTVVNNKLITTDSYNNEGSFINISDSWDDGNPSYLTIFNSIIHNNTTGTNAGGQFETTTNNGQFHINDNYNDGVEAYASYSIIGGDDDLGLSLIHI